MTLTWPVAAAVLLGALLHASWNAVLKSSSDKALETALMQATGAVLAWPALLLVGLPAPASWPFIAASVAIHVGYFVTLTGALKHGDLGLAYPLMRGTAPLLVALGSAIGLAEGLSPLAWLGVLAVSGGVLALGLAPGAHASRHAVGFALANAVLIALYTMVDAFGVRASGNPVGYVLLLFALNGWPFGLLVLARRGWTQVRPYAQERWPWALAGAVASVGSYGVALWAMTQAPVAVVAALRETSVLFALVIARLALGERFGPLRWAGAASILAGIALLRLA